jgi:hypothetical protein
MHLSPLVAAVGEGQIFALGFRLPVQTGRAIFVDQQDFEPSGQFATNAQIGCGDEMAHGFTDIKIEIFILFLGSISSFVLTWIAPRKTKPSKTPN